MGKYLLEFAKSAEKEFLRLDTQVQKRIDKKLTLLRIDPYPTGVKKLSGSLRLYRVRIGKYRIIYHVSSELRVNIVYVRKIGRRKDVYKGL